MLSVEDAKPQSNNRTKSYLGHEGRRFVGAWVSGYVWYFELSREPKHAAQQMGHQKVYLRALHYCIAGHRHCLGTIMIF